MAEENTLSLVDGLDATMTVWLVVKDGFGGIEVS